ncbi:energy-coupling factor transporter transmembrane component T [Muricomes intestini]|jgi:energy-coupling factor transport system permease protein|uniref:energy-coupling factor transporter transmembrane component T n=1 Tax=Muricomes intestini TaxID=1796634 RepID=UPI000E97FA02|nr:energy-coupling factor transporter transmembrane protein EcfT [Lachnospiraceae bacterium]
MEKSYTEKIQIHKANKLAGLHPATKFLVVILYSVCTFVLSSIKLTKIGLPLAIIPWFLVVLVLCAVSGAMKKCIKALKAVAFIALVIFLVQTFIVPGGEVLVRFGFIRICEKGLKTAISLSFLILNIAGIFVWFFQTTENKEIARALEESGLNYKATYVFISSLQMINVLSGNSKTIMNAQRARGVETEGNMLVRAKAFFPTLVPLVLGALIGSEERVLTLEARGFSMEGKKTHLFNLEKSGAEGTMKITAILVTVLIVIGRAALWIL